VPPHRLGDYLRGLEDLLGQYGYRTAVYGHFGDGCVHTKIDFDHTTASGRAQYRAFVEAAADLTVTLGGSLSGEHGDGQARGELLERMFGPALVDMFREVVRAFDPDGVLNPGRLVDARPLDADLRDADMTRRRTVATVFPFADQGGLTGAFDRCVGAGTCRRDDDRASMCPSYRATHDEQHSTRGRARLLGELLRPDTSLDGWHDAALVEALDLCLSCKACQVECPVEVDMATMRSEALHQRHDVEGMRRDLPSLLLGHVRELLEVARPAPGLANRLARSSAGRRAWEVAGLAPQRAMPTLAPRSFMQSWRRQEPVVGAAGAPVVLFVDTFTNAFAPQVAAAAVRTLRRHGQDVQVVGDVCCGRPRYGEGMLQAAQRDLDGMIAAIDAVGGDAPVVWLEPSCLSVVRDELPALRAGQAAAGRVAQRSRTFAEHLVTEDWDLRDAARRLAMRETIWHPHCHQRASLGTAADQELLTRLGLGWRDLDAGCCGLAGSFGFVAGDRYDVSIAVAEDRFAPRLRLTDPASLVIMDGFSCREQTTHLALHPEAPWHLAEVVDAAETH
jgi:Fe-S oxidoreductase